MNQVVKAMVVNRVAKLRGDNEFLTKHIQFLAQRLEDARKTLRENIQEVIELTEFLQEAETPIEAEVETDGCKFHTAPDTTHVPKHTNIIVG